MTASTPLVLYDVELIDIDPVRKMLIFQTDDGLIAAHSARCSLWQVGAIGSLRLHASGTFLFHVYPDPRLRRAADLDDEATKTWGWRIESLYIRVKGGITPGINGQVIKEDVRPVTIDVPREFLDLCEAYHVAPGEALRGFIADLCALESFYLCPREDGYTSHGSDERRLASDYWKRIYEPRAEPLPRASGSQFLSWTRIPFPDGTDQESASAPI